MGYKTPSKYRKQIEIDLEPGIYTMDTLSGTGKSYLAKQFRELYYCHEPVNSINSKEAQFVDSLAPLIPKDCKAFIIDDYDVYNGKYGNEILKLSKTAIVMIDCKMTPDIDFEVIGSSLISEFRQDYVKVDAY